MKFRQAKKISIRYFDLMYGRSVLYKKQIEKLFCGKVHKRLIPWRINRIGDARRIYPIEMIENGR